MRLAAPTPSQAITTAEPARSRTPDCTTKW